VNFLTEDRSTAQSSYDRQIRPTNAFVEFKEEDVEQSIADRFEQQVRRYPDRLAIKTKSQKFTYYELNRSSNRVAHAILARCGAADEPIALLFKQGVAMITGSLGALKAGKTYVPVDYSLPRSKATQILQDTQARLILTDNDNLSLAYELSGHLLTVINIDNLDANLLGSNPGLSISPDQLAYIHYTSGSTGEPKGVVWNHRNELYSGMLRTNALHISQDDRISLLRSNNVGATREAFLALLNGAALFPLELKEEGLTNLGTWLIDEEITVYTCVATVFRQTVKGLAGKVKFPKIRLIHIGGEPISKSDVELYKTHFSHDCIFVTRFGISETPTVSYYFINKQTEIKGERVPVGYPLEGNEVLLLDDDGKEVGVNSVGEIAIKSSYLALGYWRRPDLTSAKFLPDPKGRNARIYLTGDLGYTLPDGCLVHMGRKDFQTKIRGHRVEMSAVEMALLGIEGIKQAAVVSIGDTGEDKRLVAYVVAQGEQALTFSHLRGVLKERLPSYMLPSTYVALDSLPLTASGKVDRRALPSPGRLRPVLDNFYVGAHTPVEKVLVKLWGEVMGLDELGIHDDFSELGGDSIQAARIVSRVNNTFSLKDSLKILFEAPTVAKLAQFIIEQETNPGQSDKIANIVLKIESMSSEDIGSALEADKGNRDRA
jgi:amino acid adenylation domain-containing protein